MPPVYLSRSICHSTVTLLLCFVAFSLSGLGEDVKRHEIVPSKVNILIGADAVRKGGIKQVDIGPGKVGWIESWRDAEDSLSWDVSAAESNEYEVSVIAQGRKSRTSVQVEVDREKLSAECGAQWDRLSLGKVRLPGGNHRVTVRSKSTPPMQSFFSVELVSGSAKKDLAETAEKLLANTDWLVADRYGVMFHWTSDTKPQTGPPKAYQKAVRDFDVERFAQMVADMGARHVVFTTSHAGFYFPGPNKTIDSILPGRTCDRDLVGDMADALGKMGIKLILYFHPGHDDVTWWTRTHFKENKAEYFRQWCAIIRDIGERYGKELAGFWFDDAIFTYYPFDPPWEEMTRAAKAGNADRLVIYNSWILPRANDFYEVFAGENYFSQEVIEGSGFLPVGGSGKFTGGPQRGLQGHITTFVEGDWGHFKLDTPIEAPQFSAEMMIAGIQDCMRRKNVPTFDVEIYQDGTVSPQTFQLFKAIKRAIWIGSPSSAATSNLANIVSPAPIRSWEKYHRGWTTKWDLIRPLLARRAKQISYLPHEKPAIPRESTLPRLPGSEQSCENLLRSCGDSHSSERVSYLTISSAWHVSTARGGSRATWKAASELPTTRWESPKVKPSARSSAHSMLQLPMAGPLLPESEATR